MSNSKAVSLRIPDELLATIDLLAKEKYKSHKGTPNRSLVILDAIVSYFDTVSDSDEANNLNALVSDTVSICQFNQLQDVVSTLSDNIIQLEEKIVALSDNNRQMDKRNLLPVQLSTSDAFSLSDNVIKTTFLNSDNGLTVSQLAARLKETPQIIGSKKKNKPKEFTVWSKEKDPDLYGWRYDESSKLYFPIKPAGSGEAERAGVD